MRITVAMRGEARTVGTTALGFSADGMQLDAAYLSVVDLERRGLLLYRDTYTTASGERVCVRQEPLVVVAPEELDGVESVEADGLVLLAREGGELHRELPASLYREDGGVAAPPGAGLAIVYGSGSYESVQPTPLLFAEGFAAEMDAIRWSQAEELGVRWERSAWTVEEAGLLALREDEFVVLGPEDMPNVAVAAVDGRVVWPAEAVACGPDEGEEEEEASG